MRASFRFSTFAFQFGLIVSTAFFALLSDSAFAQKVSRAPLRRAANALTPETSATAHNRPEFVSTFPNEPSLAWPVVSSGSAYPVGSQEVSWTTREGRTQGALAFYPTRPPIDATMKFPLVVFSPGLGASAERFAYLGNSWAARGIVVLCLRHPGSDEAVWRGKARPLAALKDVYQTHWPARDRAFAIRSAIDFVESAHSTPGPFGSDVDLTKIGVGGNDLGALAALLVAGQLPPDNGPSLKDPRVAAVLAVSPPVFCDPDQAPVVYSLIDAPTMTVTGTNDDGIVSAMKAPQRRIPFDASFRNDKFLIVLQGGDHLVYAGHRLRSKQANDAPFQATVRDVSTLYWRAYLQNDVDATTALRTSPDFQLFRNARSERVFIAPKSQNDASDSNDATNVAERSRRRAY